MTEVPLMYLIGGVVVKKNVFNKLPSDHRQVLVALCAKYMDQIKLAVRKENQEAIQVMAKHGVKLIYPSADQVEEFKRISRKAMDSQTGKSFSARVKNEVINYLEQYRESKD
jgi:TRAP-type C4-dicarboxylate transport system substrate-binding protein